VRVPSDEQIHALHEQYAPTPESLDRVYDHCVIVARIAEQLLERRDLGVDPALVRAGSLLHDIGVYRLGDAPYIRHGLLGYELLRDEGFPEEICRFASRHTGVGITAEDVITQRLPLPPANYVAETPEERLVMYADKFHSKTDPPVFLTADEYESQVRRFGDDKAATFCAMVTHYGKPTLPPP
jgi:uncharacterized protein